MYFVYIIKIKLNIEILAKNVKIDLNNDKI
jgi:hypothetical protein